MIFFQKDLIAILSISISLVIYAYILEPLGFPISTFLLGTVSCLLFGAIIKTSIYAGALFSLVISFIFIVLLDISLPLGEVFAGFLN